MGTEQPLDPARPIIDPHLHFWDIIARPGALQEAQRFLFFEALEALAEAGHAVTHTVFVESGQMYRRGASAALAPVGETEFVAGIAAMSDSGNYGPARLGHRIVGCADLRLGDGLRDVLSAHVAAAGGRFRGIRTHTAYSEEGMFGFACDPAIRGVMRDPGFVQGARVLADMGLSLDVWCLHTQLAELTALADAVPDLVIVLDHLGTPETQGRWASRAEQARSEWTAAITELARRPNVVVKLGGLGMDMSGPIRADAARASSQDLADAWRPWIEGAIAAFGPERAMFESNFPPDRSAGSYGTVWNAFKRIASGYSDDEKDALFHGTAARTYGIDLS